MTQAMDYIIQNNNWGNTGGELILNYTNNSFKITSGSGTGASGSITRAPESPTNRSAPSITSAGPPARRSGFVDSANQRLTGGIEPSR